ncbi:GTP 3',8-cyclase MoaA [candidate division WOR-3 bacterium]|nr:GTP 3',8-cyclase MoaA [candidate division WOR-3 bacterium]
MRDRYGRDIYYLRISITDRCNLRCIYCMPNGIVNYIPHKDILRFEEISEIVDSATEIGFSSVRITGGEPLVRKGAPKLVGLLKEIKGIKRVTMTTNGILLNKYAEELKEKGIDSINVSLDTLDTKKYRLITRNGNLNDVLSGIEKALNIGLDIRLNVVLQKGNVDEIKELIRYSKTMGVSIRFIEYMPLDSCINLSEGSFVSSGRMIELIESEFGPIEETDYVVGDGPAKYINIKSIGIYMGIISAVSTPFCSSCNRIRITSNGIVKPCLASNIGYDIRNVVRRGHKREDITDVLIKAIDDKPLKHHLTDGNSNIEMRKIGG